jgi:hypothetical protein
VVKQTAEGRQRPLVNEVSTDFINGVKAPASADGGHPLTFFGTEGHRKKEFLFEIPATWLFASGL